MKQKQKLELTWIGKENRPKLEPRILLEDPEKSYNAKLFVINTDTPLSCLRWKGMDSAEPLSTQYVSPRAAAWVGVD